MGSKQRQLREGFAFVFIVAALALILGVPGCGGGGTSTTPALSGKQAAEATIISGDQALDGGMNYPFGLLKTAAPAGSQIGKAPLAFMARSLDSSLVSSASKITPAAAPQFSSTLNLYVGNVTVSGPTATLPFYQNATGTESAGQLQITEVGVKQFSTAYTSYPVTLNGSINITAGNLVCSGQMQVVFQGSSGQNTLTGSFNLPKNGIQTTFDMTLSSTYQVGGSCTITQNGITTEVTGLSGTLGDTLTGNATVKPEGWTGTAQFNLETGAYLLTLTIGTGEVDKGQIDSTGDLDIGYSDGTSTLITDPVTSSLTSAGGTSGSTTGATTGSTTSETTGSTTSGTTGSTTSGTTGSTTGSAPTELFNTPAATNLAKYSISGYSSSDALVGNTVGQYNEETPYYFATPTSSAETLDSTGASNNSAIANSVNKLNQIVGLEGLPSTPSQLPIYWSSPTAKYSVLKMPAGYTIGYAMWINDGGVIVGAVGTPNAVTEYTLTAAYWSSPTATATVMNVTGMNGYATAANMISNDGVALGPYGIYWPTVSGAPKLLIPNSAAGDPNATCVSNFGIAGTVYTGASTPDTIWPSPSYTTTTLSPVSGYGYNAVNTINDSGEVGGSLANGAIALAALWDSKGHAELITSAIPSSPPFTDTLTGVNIILQDGSAVVAGGKATYYLTTRTGTIKK